MKIVTFYNCLTPTAARCVVFCVGGGGLLRFEQAAPGSDNWKIVTRSGPNSPERRRADISAPANASTQDLLDACVNS